VSLGRVGIEDNFLKEVVGPFLDLGKGFTDNLNFVGDEEEGLIEDIFLKVEGEFLFDNLLKVITNIFLEIDPKITVLMHHFDIYRFGDNDSGYVFLTPGAVDPFVIGKI
jgi:hypothetical protein